ncbi:MAG: 2-amino-4-hydroxy-6-hydroxymethyldihydropteridine diphosphokinase [Flavobacteriaceae bacterium]
MNSLQKIFISLGTNQGDRFQSLQLAINALYENIGDTLVISPVYETKSWGFDSEDFLNCCVCLTTELTLEKLLTELQKIEITLGRVKKTTNTYEARCIDIDILFYNDVVLETTMLTVPHKSIQDRNFVLTPLNDIASEFVHPKFQKTISSLLQVCADDNPVIKIRKALNNPFNFHAFSKFNFITIEGNIGSGKTSLVHKIARDYNAKFILERFADNAFLPKFYKDQSRFAFPLEMSFLADRYKQLSDDIAQYDLFKEFVVADYHISKSLTFAKVTLPEDEFALYRKFFNVIYKDMQQPDAYIYLYQNTKRLLENIELRGRDYEQNIQPDYLEKINKGYVEFIKSQPDLNVRVIDVSGLDFVKNRKDYIHIIQQICS